MTKTAEPVWCFWSCHSGCTVCSKQEAAALWLSSVWRTQQEGFRWEIARVAGQCNLVDTHRHTAALSLVYLPPLTPCISKDQMQEKGGSKCIHYGGGTYQPSCSHDFPRYVCRHYIEISTERNIFIDVNPQAAVRRWWIKIKLKKEIQNLLASSFSLLFFLKYINAKRINSWVGECR